MSNFRNVYQATALIILNTLIMFALLNLILWAVFAVRDAQRAVPLTRYVSDAPVTASGLFFEDGRAVDNGKRSTSNLQIFDFKAFEGVMNEIEIAAMLDEFYDHYRELGFSYQPWTQYGHRVFEGEYLNVSKLENGLTARRTVSPAQVFEGEEPIQIAAFGGSTTFGAGVADADTWPSQLSKILTARASEMGLGAPIEVVNYGRVGFYPTQEMHLFQQVLRSGARPELAIFLDGVNLGRADDTPNLTPEYHRFVNEAQLGRGSAMRWLPVMRAVTYITRAPTSQNAPKPTNRTTAEHAVNRFVHFQDNVRSIAQLYNVESLFILQPDGHYNYPYHLTGPGKPLGPRENRILKEQFYADLTQKPGFVDMTDLFEKWGDRKALMDVAHYSPNFSRFVAEHIAELIDLEALKQIRQPDAAPTGVPRRQ